jgi:hypothetical protein
MYAPGDSGNLFGFVLATRIGDLISEANSMPYAECRMPNEIWHMAWENKVRRHSGVAKGDNECS